MSKEVDKMSIYGKRFIKILMAIIISQILCYYLIDSIFIRLSLISSNTGLILFRISAAISLYSLINIIFRKNIIKRDIDILAIAYCILVINITLFKEFGNLSIRCYSIDFFDLLESMASINSLVMAIGNIGAYIPIGAYIIYRFKDKSKIKYIIPFAIYIVMIELIQYIFKLGIFDINDIILNLIGFCIGINFSINDIKLKNILIDNIVPIMVFLNICILFIMIYSVNSDSSQNFILFIFTGMLNKKAMDS